jgi:hypothetical protein
VGDRRDRERQQVEAGLQPGLFGQADVARDDHRRCRGKPGRNQVSADVGGSTAAHVESDRRLRIGQPAPIEVERAAGRRVRGDEFDAARLAAQRQR